jgi:hypothetical protein
MFEATLTVIPTIQVEMDYDYNLFSRDHQFLSELLDCQHRYHYLKCEITRPPFAHPHDGHALELSLQKTEEEMRALIRLVEAIDSVSTYS